MERRLETQDKRNTVWSEMTRKHEESSQGSRVETSDPEQEDSETWRNQASIKIRDLHMRARTNEQTASRFQIRNLKIGTKTLEDMKRALKPHDKKSLAHIKNGTKTRRHRSRFTIE